MPPAELAIAAAAAAALAEAADSRSEELTYYSLTPPFNSSSTVGAPKDGYSMIHETPKLSFGRGRRPDAIAEEFEWWIIPDLEIW
jgi:hypothetical protein